LPRLIGAREEVAAVARLVPNSEVTILEGSQATADHVRELASQYTVLHFATHGMASENQPFDSFLALGSSPSGRLTARDIYGFNLQADLVFLSACQSGMGKVSGDGIIGLTRAFLYAGTRSVIASLWDVADLPTSRLVASFYRNWLQDKDKGRALRTAQLWLLHDLRTGQLRIRVASDEFSLPEDPIFWASFVLEGEP
jgi:CHAT domain-containing protein